MKPMLSLRCTSGGFALPTVLIASVILLTILVTSVTAVGSISSALSSQYYNQLAREAAESGLARARACLRASNYTPTWTDAAPLKPDTNCNGTVSGSLSKWVVNNNNVQSSFTVGLPQSGAVGSLRVLATGRVELVRSSNQTQVWRTYSYVAAENSRYNDTPQIAGGAGWKENGHNGYMLASTGVLYGWGDNTSLQLGDASLGATVSTPIKVVMPDGVDRAKKVFNSGQGASILCILATHSTTGDQVYCRGAGMGLGGTGWQRFGLTAGLTALDMSLNGYGSDSACVKASDLQAYCAGYNGAGGLGNGTTSTAFVALASPGKFRLDLANPGPLSGSAASLTVQKIYNQDSATCVIASDNQAYCAGINSYGQLGQNNFTVNVASIGKSIPGRAQIPGNASVVEVAHTYHTAQGAMYFRAADGTVYTSGNNGYGTANDTYFDYHNPPGCEVANWVNCYSIPRGITSPNMGKLISIGEQGNDFSGLCAVKSVNEGNSGFWCIGSNTYGELGTGDCVRKATYYAPIFLQGEVATYLMNAESTYQMNSMVIITTAGNAYAAGDNTYGKLGTGGPLQACNGNFAKVQLPAGVKAVAVANGDEYSTFILGDNGKIYAMGRNHNGQLGDGTTTNRSTPVEVKLPRQATVY